MASTEEEVINLDDYKSKGSKSKDRIIIRDIEKIPPGVKPDIEHGKYYHVKLVGLTLEGADANLGSVAIPSILPSIYVVTQFRRISKVPLMQLKIAYDGWLITYQSILSKEIKCDGNVILIWMGCSNINEAIGLNWEGMMPLQYGDRNSSLIVPNIVQMRRDLGL